MGRGVAELYDLRLGDCRDVLKSIPDNSVDSACMDPPYALVSIIKRFGNSSPADVQKNAIDRKLDTQGASPYSRTAAGFMGEQWDTGETAFSAEFWAEVLRVLKPGGHLLAFSGTRTQHRMVCAIEDAGFDIRDQLGWLFGSGFPKSHDAERAIARHLCTLPGRHYERTLPPPEKAEPGDHICPECAESVTWKGWGTGLKPAWEPICLARKPMIGTVAENLLKYGVGVYNIGASMIAADDGRARWPANLIHDGSDIVVDLFPDSNGCRVEKPSACATDGNTSFNAMRGNRPARGFDDEGSAARFFYCPKASGADRDEGLPPELENKHPTVKPTDLMRYLCALVTPPGGLVLDPFMGSGSAGKAAMQGGFRFIGIEREDAYMAIAAARVAAARRAALLPTSAKRSAKPRPVAAGQADLFASE
jgi:site-specific DNA-methyltransferase (adenine-specific)